LQTIAAGAVRSNIETFGLNLVELIGREIEIGEAVLFLYEARDPCSQMNAVCQGLRELMMNQRQGVMAEVRRGGRISAGDAVRVR
jgi:MOSC domain-containing protein YiiM